MTLEETRKNCSHSMTLDWENNRDRDLRCVERCQRCGQRRVLLKIHLNSTTAIIYPQAAEELDVY